MEKTKKSALPVGLAVFLTVIAFLISWLWLEPQYKQNQADAAKVDHELSAVKGKLESLKAAQSTLTSLGPTVDSMFVAIPGDQDTGNIITTLEAIATTNKTYIPSFQISGGTSATASSSSTTTPATTPGAASTTEQNTNPSVVSVSFSANGAFADLTAFVKAVENNLKFFNVKSLTLASDEKGAMSTTLQLEAYTQNNTSSLSADSSIVQ